MTPQFLYKLYVFFKIEVRLNMEQKRINSVKFSEKQEVDDVIR